MSKKKKSVEDNGVMEVKETVPERKVSFFAWFEKARKTHKLREYHDYALQIFFEKQGLTDMEVSEKYDEAFKRF